MHGFTCIDCKLINSVLMCFTLFDTGSMASDRDAPPENSQENSQERDAPDTNAPPDTEAKEVARGITIMKGIVRHRDQGLVYPLEWNSDKQAIGPNSAKLTSYIGTLVRMHIPVSTPKWTLKRKPLEEKKDAIWDELQVYIIYG